MPRQDGRNRWPIGEGRRRHRGRKHPCHPGRKGHRWCGWWYAGCVCRCNLNESALRSWSRAMNLGGWHLHEAVGFLRYRHERYPGWRHRRCKKGHVRRATIGAGATPEALGPRRLRRVTHKRHSWRHACWNTWRHIHAAGRSRCSVACAAASATQSEAVASRGSRSCLMCCSTGSARSQVAKNRYLVQQRLKTGQPIGQVHEAL